MKELLLLFLLSAYFVTSNAQNVSEAKAKEVADHFFCQRNITNLTVKEIDVIRKNGNNCLYVINYSPQGWIMISGQYSSNPVLGYSSNGNYRYSESENQNINYIVDHLVEKINTDSKNALLKKNKAMWSSFINKDQYFKLKSTVTTKILSTPEWGQSLNNSGTCSPSYNSEVPSGSNSGCNCGYKPVGCGPVAIAGILWYYKYPTAYNWNGMPSAIYRDTPTYEATAIANLLALCGSAANTVYWCAGSWTTVNNVEDAFKDAFNFQAVSKEKKEHWGYKDAWGDLIRSEIDNNRPVIYRGDKADLSTEKHIWICDGYDLVDKSLFHMNWGWRGVYNGFIRLNDITPGSNDYNENEMIVAGISPTYNAVTNITSYDNIEGGSQTLTALNDIILPGSGSDLSISNNADVVFEAGNEIILKPGFSVSEGSQFTAKINEDINSSYDISVEQWNNAFSPNGDGINDTFKFTVYGADSYQCEIFDVRTGASLVQTAGIINGNPVEIWKGDGAYAQQKYEEYRMLLKFKNSYGRKAEKEYAILVGDNTYANQNKSLNVESLKTINDVTSYYLTYELNDVIFETQSTQILSETKDNLGLTIYPNPSDGMVMIDGLSLNVEHTIGVYDMNGKQIYTNTSKSNSCELNLESCKSGFYIIKIVSDDNIVYRKILINR